jgi:hypothetical protein
MSTTAPQKTPLSAAFKKDPTSSVIPKLHVGIRFVGHQTALFELKDIVLGCIAQ